MKHIDIPDNIRDAFHQFARNGFWGTCVDCPRTEGQAFPEFCLNYARCDHRLNLKQLAEIYEYNRLQI
jgi:hypothetical protein